MKTALIVLALTALAGAAGAQPLNLRLPDPATPASPFPVAPEPARPSPDLANPLDPIARPVPQAKALESAVFARTSVDTRLAGRDSLKGSVGVLCGLQPGHNESGGAAAYGVDPHGRFVGAKFSVAF